jgi:hypothetical protein
MKKSKFWILVLFILWIVTVINKYIPTNARKTYVILYILYEFIGIYN